jgi:hypothetical protein
MYCSDLKNVCFEGNAVPDTGQSMFWGDPVSVVNYVGSGWGSSFGSVPTAPCTQCLGSTNTNPPPTTYTLTINASTGGTAAASPTSGATGSTSTLTANASANYSFSSWTIVNAGGGSLSSTTANPTTFTFGNANATVSAGFNAIPPQFTPTQTGSVLGNTTGNNVGPIDLQPSGAPNLALVIHGWTPPWAQSPYSGDQAMPKLKEAIQAQLPVGGINGGWDVRFVDWSKLPAPLNSHGTAQNAVRNAADSGLLLGMDIESAGYKNVFLVSHSAGAWMANDAALWLSTVDTPPTLSVAFLAPFIPQKFFVQLNPTDTLYSADKLGVNFPAEQYFVDRNSPGVGLGQVLQNAVNYDITAIQVDAGDINVLDSHGWPIRWYTHTVQDSSWKWGEGVGYQKAFHINNTKGSDFDLTVAGLIPHVSHAVVAKDQSLDLQFPATEVYFQNLSILAQGGNGSVSSNTNGVQMATTNFIWETFSLNVTNDFNFGDLAYSLSNHCNSVVGMYMDGQPITFIQSMPQNELSTEEMFPLSTAFGKGNHSLTVSLESLDGTPIVATLEAMGFYLAVTPPPITSQSITNGQFSIAWEAGAGLKYQPQYNTKLTSTNWTNLGGLLTSPTNTIMSAAKAIGTNRQEFYRVALEQ